MKALTLQWRRHDGEDDQQTNRLLPAKSDPPATQPSPPALSPQPSTSSTPDTTQPTSLPTPPLPATSVLTPPPPTSVPTPPPATGKTSQLLHEIFTDCTHIEPTTDESCDTFFSVTLAQLETLVEKQLCLVRSCWSRMTVIRPGEILQTVCKKCHTVASSASPPT